LQDTTTFNYITKYQEQYVLYYQTIEILLSCLNEKLSEVQKKGGVCSAKMFAFMGINTLGE